MNVAKLNHRRGLASVGKAWDRWTARMEMEPRGWRRKAVGSVLALALAMMGSSSAQACRLAVLGDSLASGYGVAATDAFPVRLQAALEEGGVTCEVLNAGVSGDTSAGGAARLEWVLGDQPTHLLVELGGNDALRGLPADQLYANLDQIIRNATARGVPVMLAGMLAPPNLGRSYGEEFRQVYTSLAEEHDIPLYTFFLDGVILQEGLMQDDGIHPNARGVAVIVERIAPMVVDFLQDE